VHVLVGYRPQSSGFTSSHAANHFGIAALLILFSGDLLQSGYRAFFLFGQHHCYAQVM